MKKYLVTLTAEERQHLRNVIVVGKASAKKLTHARILFKADVNAGGPDWTDTRIAEAVEVSVVDDDFPHPQQFFGGELSRCDGDAFIGGEETGIFLIEQPGWEDGRILDHAHHPASDQVLQRRVLRPSGQYKVQIERQLIAVLLPFWTRTPARCALGAVRIDAVEKQRNASRHRLRKIFGEVDLEFDLVVKVLRRRQVGCLQQLDDRFGHCRNCAIIRHAVDLAVLL